MKNSRQPGSLEYSPPSLHLLRIDLPLFAFSRVREQFEAFWSNRFNFPAQSSDTGWGMLGSISNSVPTRTPQRQERSRYDLR